MISVIESYESTPEILIDESPSTFLEHSAYYKPLTTAALLEHSLYY